MATLKEGEHGERSQSIEFKNVIHGFMTRSVDDPTFDASVADDERERSPLPWISSKSHALKYYFVHLKNV